MDNINDANRGLFQSNKIEIIKKHIKRFELAQRLEWINDVSNFVINSNDVYYMSKIKRYFNNFTQYINFCKDYCDDDDEPLDPYPGFKNIYDAYELFCSKFKIKYEEDSDSGSFWDYVSDSDSDVIDIADSEDSESDSDSD